MGAVVMCVVIKVIMGALAVCVVASGDVSLCVG